MAEGRLYATAFGENHDASERLARISEPRGFLFEVESGERVLQGLVTPHHPTRVDGGWIVCSSWQGTVERYADDGTLVASVALDGWTRGIAEVDGTLVVGVSGVRHHATARASIVVLDAETLEERHRQELPTREVYAIVAVPAGVVEGVRIGWNNNPARQRQQARSVILNLPGVAPVARWAQGPGRVRRSVWSIGRRVARRALPGPRGAGWRLDRTPPLAPAAGESIFFATELDGRPKK